MNPSIIIYGNHSLFDFFGIPIFLSQDTLNQGFEYIAIDADGDIYIYEAMPVTQHSDGQWEVEPGTKHRRVADVCDLIDMELAEEFSSFYTTEVCLLSDLKKFY